MTDFEVNFSENNPEQNANFNLNNTSDTVINFSLEDTEVNADFSLDNSEINANFEADEAEVFNAILQLDVIGAFWGSIRGNIEDQTDLKNWLDEKANTDYVDDKIQNTSDTINARIDDEVEALNSAIENKVETVNGSDLIGVSRENNEVTITSKTFVFEQAIPATKWVINHNLNKRPSIDLTYYNGDRFEAYKQYVNNNQVVIYHKNPTVGFAYLN
jgi:hypothetical protein